MNDNGRRDMGGPVAAGKQGCECMALFGDPERSTAAEALVAATYLLNRRPSSSIKHLTPYQKLHKKSPDLAHLRVFGCLCYPHFLYCAA